MPENENTSKRFHFYSPTSAAGTRGVYHVPTTTSLPRRGCINFRQKLILTWNIFDVQNTFHTPQPHVRRGRTWGYRGATSATWQTTRRFGRPKTKSCASFFGFSLNLQYLWIRYAAFRQTKKKMLRFFFWVFSQLAVSLQTK